MCFTYPKLSFKILNMNKSKFSSAEVKSHLAKRKSIFAIWLKINWTLYTNCFSSKRKKDNKVVSKKFPAVLLFRVKISVVNFKIYYNSLIWGIFEFTNFLSTFFNVLHLKYVSNSFSNYKKIIIPCLKTSNIKATYVPGYGDHILRWPNFLWENLRRSHNCSSTTSKFGLTEKRKLLHFLTYYHYLEGIFAQ